MSGFEENSHHSQLTKIRDESSLTLVRLLGANLRFHCQESVRSVSLTSNYATAALTHGLKRMSCPSDFIILGTNHKVVPGIMKAELEYAKLGKENGIDCQN